MELVHWPECPGGNGCKCVESGSFRLIDTRERVPALGISLRLIREYDPEKDTQPPGLLDQAFMLVVTDQRDLPFAEKLDDALAFLIARGFS
jgi:hypothetical protein